MEQETYILQIDGFGSEGQGVAHRNGWAIFVPGALRGETVLARIKTNKKNYAVADLLEVIAPSAARTSPACIAYDACGGCQLQHLQYAEQLALKTQVVASALYRLAKVHPIKINPCLGAAEIWRYRERANVHLQLKNGRLEVGFYSESSHDLVPLDHCLLLPEAFLDLTRLIVRDCNDQGQRGLHTLLLRQGNISGEIMAVLIGKASKQILQSCTASWQKEIPALQGVVFQTEAGKNYLLSGTGQIGQHLLGCDFIFYPESFAQVNVLQTAKLYACVQSMAAVREDWQILDVYCGVGTIGQVLAQGIKNVQVIGIEENMASVAAAHRNAGRNQIERFAYFAGKAEAVLPDLAANGILHLDLAVVDPPRAGCREGVLKAILELKPAKIIYVSCHPATLARDLEKMVANQYAIKEVQPVDMFPQTSHVETVVLMSRKDK